MMPTPADQFLQATEALIAAKIASARLNNVESEALTAARKRFLEVAAPNIVGWVIPGDSA